MVVLGAAASLSLAFVAEAIAQSRQRKADELVDVDRDARRADAARDLGLVDGPGPQVDDPQAGSTSSPPTSGSRTHTEVNVLTVRKAESVGTYSNVRLVVVGLSVFGAALSLFIQPVLAPLLLLLPTLIVVSERSTHDAVTFLTVLVLALVLIPSGQVVGPLGSAGRPAGLLGLLALWWWAHAHLVADSGVDRSLQPVRISALLFLGAVVASYAAAFVRPIDPLEARAADRGLMALLGFFGALLLTADGIVDRARLEVLLRRMVMAGAFIAALAVLQFFTGVGLGGVFRIPGLQELGSIQAIQDRSTFNRVSATASHPIELGVVLGMLFPLAVHFGLHSGRRIQWVYVALIGMAVPMSVSRSGTLALGIGALVLWLSWPIAFKVRSVAIAGAFMMAMRLVVPGLLGTIRSLFTSWFVDDSIKGRTSDYPLVGQVLHRRTLHRSGVRHLPAREVHLPRQPVPRAAHRDRSDRHDAVPRRRRDRVRRRPRQPPVRRRPDPLARAGPRRRHPRRCDQRRDLRSLRLRHGIGVPLPAPGVCWCAVAPGSGRPGAGRGCGCSPSGGPGDQLTGRPALGPSCQTLPERVALPQ